MKITLKKKILNCKKLTNYQIADGIIMLCEQRIKEKQKKEGIQV